jgi:hypothetical protein
MRKISKLGVFAIPLFAMTSTMITNAGVFQKLSPGKIISKSNLWLKTGVIFRA